MLPRLSASVLDSTLDALGVGKPEQPGGESSAGSIGSVEGIVANEDVVLLANPASGSGVRSVVMH